MRSRPRVALVVVQQFSAIGSKKPEPCVFFFLSFFFFLFWTSRHWKMKLNCYGKLLFSPPLPTDGCWRWLWKWMWTRYGAGRGENKEKKVISFWWRIAVHLTKLTMSHPSIGAVLTGTNGATSRALESEDWERPLLTRHSNRRCGDPAKSGISI